MNIGECPVALITHVAIDRDIVRKQHCVIERCKEYGVVIVISMSGILHDAIKINKYLVIQPYSSETLQITI